MPDEDHRPLQTPDTDLRVGAALLSFRCHGEGLGRALAVPALSALPLIAFPVGLYRAQRSRSNGG